MLQIKKILIDLYGTLGRFPIPIMASVLGFIFFSISIHTDSSDLKGFVFIKLALESVSGISYFIALDIFAESKKIDLGKRVGLSLLGFCMLGLHYYSIIPAMLDSESVFLTRYLVFITCFHVLVSFSAFYDNDENQNFWQFNFYLLTSISIAIVYSVTLFLGVAGALYAVEKLLKIYITTNAYLDLFLFVFIFLNTLFFLYQIPKSFDVFSHKTVFKNSLRIFVQYILLPILLLYILILYIYLFDIVLTGVIPSNAVCIPIFVFSIIGVFTYLLIYPIRKDKQYKLLYFFSKYFFYILLPLLSLYFIAITLRILSYGVTEDRYLIVVLGIWLLVISIYILSSKKDNIIIIPISLFVILFISSFGPWGLFQLSIQNQVRRLEYLLNKNHLLVNNKLVSNENTHKISNENLESIRSILNYLNKRGQINQIHKWLDEENQNILNNAISKNELESVNAIFSDLQFQEQSPIRKISISPNYEFLNELPLSSSEFKNMISFSKDENIIQLHKATATISHDSLFIQYHNDTLCHVHFDTLLNPILYSINQRLHQEDESNRLNNKMKLINRDQEKKYLISNDSLIFRSVKCKIYINKISFNKRDSILIVNEMNGILLY
ncbi:MAG TPA: DUF4153 domain-containing protein [Chitinophagaceae bacterium]|nr:DUF4153 domain-containing protein [Chitinophagaceae bacterium]